MDEMTKHIYNTLKDNENVSTYKLAKLAGVSWSSTKTALLQLLVLKKVENTKTKILNHQQLTNIWKCV